MEIKVLMTAFDWGLLLGAIVSLLLGVFWFGLRFNRKSHHEKFIVLEKEKIELKEKLQASASLETEFQMLRIEKAQLETRLSEKLESFALQKKQLLDQQDQLKKQFEVLANDVLEKKSQSFQQTNQESIEKLLQPFKLQIEGFQKRVNEVHTDSIKGQASLASEIKKVLEVGLRMSDDANNLTSALKGDKKKLGNWGEAQLEKSLQLAGLESGDHYASQEKYEKEGKTYYPDFVIKLPDQKHLILDSKVSLVDYERYISAEKEVDASLALKAHVKAVRNHIEDLSKKNYTDLIGIRSPSFVIMFMPIESAYIEAMKMDKHLFNDGYQKNVILVSHTTLMPILRTVANLWALEKNNESARELSQKAGDIYNNVVRIAESLHKVGKTIGTLTNHYNSAVTGLVGKQGLYGKVTHFQSLSSKAVEKLPEIELMTVDERSVKLEEVVETNK